MKKLIFTIILGILGLPVLAQNVTILPSGITPAMGGSYPRLSYDAIVALPSPQEGDIAYDLTYKCLRTYVGTKWICTHQTPSDPTPNVASLITEGGTSEDRAEDIAIDGSGNIYVTGYFRSTVTFGSTPKTSAGLSDIFVAKYNSSGVLQWVQTAGGTDIEYSNDIAVDNSGNVFIIGQFSGTATFGATIKTSAGNNDIFVVKYNTNGALQWVQTSGGSADDYGYGIGVDGSGNSYITGSFNGTCSFGATSKTSAGGRDIFVAKYNTNGVMQWVQTAGGGNNDDGNGIAVDGSGNVHITGSFVGTASFGVISKTSAGSFDVFIAKYNTSGVVQWVQAAGGTSSDGGDDIAVDGSGNVYITGSFTGTATFGATSKTSEGNSDIFVTKYNNSGTHQWVQVAGGTASDDGFGIAVDGSSNVYITGYFSEAATFSVIPKLSLGNIDIFVLKYNSNGSLQWVQTAGGASQDGGKGIVVEGSNNVLVAGYFSETATFGTTFKTSLGGNDAVVMRLQQ